MADKFPEIEIDAVGSTDVDIANSDDFLKREKDVLGDEFESQFPAVDQVPAEDGNGDDDDEFDDFNEPQAATSNSEDFAAETPSHIANAFENLNLDDSQHFKEWKGKREEELQKKEEGYERKKKDTLKEAEKAIDDFYETYNSKKEAALEEAKAAEKKFIEERDADKTSVSVWDGAIALLGLDKNSNSIDDELLRDKTRFKEILLSLKGKSNVPGSD